MVLNCSKESLQPLLRQQHAEQEAKRWNEKSPTIAITDDPQRQNSVNVRRKLSRRIQVADVASNSICSNSATDDVDSIRIIHNKKRVHFAKSRDSSRRKYPRAKSKSKSDVDAGRGRSSSSNAGLRSDGKNNRDRSVLSPNTVRRITNKVNEDAYTIYGRRRRREEPLPASSSRSKTTRSSRHYKKKTREKHHAKEESIGEECPQLVDVEDDKISTTSENGSDVVTVELDAEKMVDDIHSPENLPVPEDPGNEYSSNWSSTRTRVSITDNEVDMSPVPSIPNEREEVIEKVSSSLECSPRHNNEANDSQHCEPSSPLSSNSSIDPHVITIEEPLLGLNDGYLDVQIHQSPTASTASDWTDISERMLAVISPSISITSKSEDDRELPTIDETNEPPHEEQSSSPHQEQQSSSTCIISSPSLGPGVTETIEESSTAENQSVELPIKTPHESFATEKTSIFTEAYLPIFATGDSKIVSEEPITVLQESEIFTYPLDERQTIRVERNFASRILGPYRFAKQRKPQFIYTKRIQRLPPNLQFPDYLFETDPIDFKDTLTSRLRRNCAQQKLATRKILQRLNEFCLPVKGIFGHQDSVSKGYKQNKTSNLRLRNMQIVPAHIVDHFKKFNRPPFCSYVNQKIPDYLVTYS